MAVEGLSVYSTIRLNYFMINVSIDRVKFKREIEQTGSLEVKVLNVESVNVLYDSDTD